MVVKLKGNTAQWAILCAGLGIGMKSIVFHVGMPKCATTTIQDFLTSQGAWLEERGFCYKKHPDDPTENQGNAAQLAEYAMNGTRAQVLEHLDFFLNCEGNVILSSEMLFGLGRGNGFETIQQEVLRRGRELRVIVYIKRQDLWIESDYKQHVKDGNLWQGDFAQLLAMRQSKRTLDYNFTLTNWSNQVGHARMSAVALNLSQDEGYAIDSFLSLLGLPRPEAEIAAPRQNVSPSASATEAARQIKLQLIGAGMAPDDIRNLIQRFLESVRDVSLDVPGDGFLSPVARRALLSELAASNAELSRSFLGGKPTFDDLPQDDMADWVPPTERVPAILAGVIAKSLRQERQDDRSPVQSDAPLTASGQPEGAVSLLARMKSLLHR